MFFQKKRKEASPVATEFERCVLCGAMTNIPRSMSIDLRCDYIPGTGQLCHNCAAQNVHEEQEAMCDGFSYKIPVYRRKL